MTVEKHLLADRDVAFICDPSAHPFRRTATGIRGAARRMSRRQAFIDVARMSFLRNGYEATTMSSIAHLVGGSKSTLWNCFHSKDELFGAVVSQLAHEHSQALTIDLQSDAEPLVVLKRLARAILSVLLSPTSVSLHRMVIAEAKRFPHLADLYFEYGPRLCIAQVADFLALLMKRGTIRAGDSNAAARQFFALCRAGRYDRALLGLGADDPQVSKQEIDEIVGSFLLGWVAASARIDLDAIRQAGGPAK